MMSYLRNSIKKFKDDAFAKMFYDIVKWLMLFTIALVITKVIPHNTTFADIISREFSISLYAILFFTVSIIIATMVVVYLLFSVKYKKLQTDFFTDALTGLKNHKALKQRLNSQFFAHQNGNEVISFILIDVDNFKTINDGLGYNTADKLLGKLGELLGNDRRATDEIYRFFERGDEFFIVLKETNLTDAQKAAERKRQLISKTIFEVDGNIHTLTVCCGVTELKKDSDTYDTLTDRLKNALQLAKSQPRKNTIKAIV